MAADRGYYYGWEVEIRLAIEATYGTASATAGDYIHPAYIRSFGFEYNENIEQIWTADNVFRMNHGDEVKGDKTTTANMSFWMADDFGASDVEPFMAKLAISRYNNVSGAGPYVYEFPEDDGNFPGDSIYGDYDLMPFTIEWGWNKVGDIRYRKVTGTYVNRQTFRAARGEKCMWTWEMIAQTMTKATSIVGTGSKSTNAPLDWSSVVITWTGENDSAVAHSGLSEVEFVVDNGMIALKDLSLATGLRQPVDFLMEKRLISGTMTWFKKTTAGQKWTEIVFSATAAKTSGDNTIQLGQLTVTINSKLNATESLAYVLYEVIVGTLPEDIDFEKLTELTLPFTARYIQGVITTDNTANIWASWDSQAGA